MIMKPIVLLGAAVYTRDAEPGKDYDWYVKMGDIQLFKTMEEIHRLALRDANGEVPKIAVMIEKQRIGFLIADMPSQRLDHSNRVIYDTFYLEFDISYQRSVLHAAAILLLCSRNDYHEAEKHFTEYAERLFYNWQAPQLILDTVKLPIVDKQPDLSLTWVEPDKLALSSNSVNQNRCARYLINFNAQPDNNFVFISTGRINLKKCQQVADKIEKCLLLTTSSEVLTEIKLKKGTLYTLSKMIKLTKY